MNANQKRRGRTFSLPLNDCEAAFLDPLPFASISVLLALGQLQTPLSVFASLNTVRQMSASEIIGEIQRLSPSEQAEVIQFAYRLDAERMLSGKELGALAQRMIDAADPAEKLRIREELTRGFYGGKANA
jgi:hypothetical protein